MSDPVYMLFALTVNDEAKYGKYLANVGATFDVDVDVLVATAEPTVVEGELPAERFVLLRFLDRDAAFRWYNSDAYVTLRQLRHEGADNPFVLLFDAVTVDGN